MKRLKIVIPTMVIVAFLATWVLGKNHSEVSLYIRILIAAGGAVLSGVLSYFLSKPDVERVDKELSK